MREFVSQYSDSLIDFLKFFSGAIIALIGVYAKATLNRKELRYKNFNSLFRLNINRYNNIFKLLYEINKISYKGFGESDIMDSPKQLDSMIVENLLFINVDVSMSLFKIQGELNTAIKTKDAKTLKSLREEIVRAQKLIYHSVGIDRIEFDFNKYRDET